MVAGSLRDEDVTPALDWRTRARLFLTIPHSLFVIALIILISFIAVTIRAETSRQAEADRLAQRCAFMYVVAQNDTNISDLQTSIQSLNRHVKFDVKYKIIIAHEDIPPVVQGRLQAVSETSLHFHQIELKPMRDRSDHVDADVDVTQRDGEDGTNSTHNVTNIPTASQMKRRATQHINHFWFHTLLLNDAAKTSQPFADIDYVVRMHQGWQFSADIPRDVLKDFVASGAQYGHHEGVGRICGSSCTSDSRISSLKELVTSYVELNGITPRSMQLWAPVIQFPSQHCLPFFNSYFEILNMRFFRSHSGIQDWIRVVDANGGMFGYGWSDRVLRYLTVALYAAPEKITKLDLASVPLRRIGNSSEDLTSQAQPAHDLVHTRPADDVLARKNGDAVSVAVF